MVNAIFFLVQNFGCLPADILMANILAIEFFRGWLNVEC
jgi:hypothetical protein